MSRRHRNLLVCDTIRTSDYFWWRDRLRNTTRKACEHGDESGKTAGGTRTRQEVHKSRSCSLPISNTIQSPTFPPLLLIPLICEEYRDGDCPSSSVVNATVSPCLCDSDCPKPWKCCTTGTSFKTQLICQAPASSTQSLTLICGMNEQFSSCHTPCQPSCDDPTLVPCPPPTCIPGCHCQPGFIRADGSVRSACVPRAACSMYDVSRRCADERRQYHSCGSACPVSCANRNSPRCHESCVSGCFCRIPYVLENGNDPLHSRCILPSQCPFVTTSGYEMNTGSIRAVIPFSNKNWLRKASSEIYPTPGTPTLLPDSNQCSDPLKNYLNCGSSCPVGCNNLIPSTTCSLACVSGCFCRTPYILTDANDPQSGCVLPSHCPRNSSTAGTCADPRKVWTSCGALQCARSCTNPLGRCEAGVCSPGCVCREPYVLQDPIDPSSRCVLPSECERKCSDPLKEFVVCGSSCPVGCDNRRPQSCTPCESGCFCKNELSPLCPTTTVDVGGRSCAVDSDCPVEQNLPLLQRCCRSVIVPMAVNPQRCTCADPYAVWSPCGSLCPEYCGQPATPLCSSTCKAGCHCALGYVKARNDVAAPCVPRTSCPNLTIARNNEPRAIMKEIPMVPKNPFTDQQLATANLVPSQKLVTGRFSFTQISANNLRINGVLSGLPPGEHAVVIHQFGDLSDGCSHLGPPFLFKGGVGTPSLGDVVVDDSSTASFSRVVDWPIIDVIGRSIAIYRYSTTEYSLHTKNEAPLACGTIGLTSFN
ncbi:copper/zinc superoxide dismutase [Dictyocaulus viviparus]|uniref:Copper/zinc superoxide dismutase n=1 Tax=Dictyocaulus viviparus TaxID=29172 RepID=A0A0D8XY97_DICVI|nr:copper/zinc superoxide dismutase [Dictyocaulus viviparus]